jgi:hypothetical protein
MSSKTDSASERHGYAPGIPNRVRMASGDTRSAKPVGRRVGVPRASQSSGGGRSVAAVHGLGTDAAGLNWRGRGSADTGKSFEFVEAWVREGLKRRLPGRPGDEVLCQP